MKHSVGEISLQMSHCNLFYPFPHFENLCREFNRGLVWLSEKNNPVFILMFLFFKEVSHWLNCSFSSPFENACVQNVCITLHSDISCPAQLLYCKQKTACCNTVWLNQRIHFVHPVTAFKKHLSSNLSTHPKRTANPVPCLLFPVPYKSKRKLVCRISF